MQNPILSRKSNNNNHSTGGTLKRVDSYPNDENMNIHAHKQYNSHPQQQQHQPTREILKDVTNSSSGSQRNLPPSGKIKSSSSLQQPTKQPVCATSITLQPQIAHPPHKANHQHHQGQGSRAQPSLLPQINHNNNRGMSQTIGSNTTTNQPQQQQRFPYNSNAGSMAPPSSMNPTNTNRQSLYSSASVNNVFALLPQNSFSNSSNGKLGGKSENFSRRESCHSNTLRLLKEEELLADDDEVNSCYTSSSTSSSSVSSLLGGHHQAHTMNYLTNRTSNMSLSSQGSGYGIFNVNHSVHNCSQISFLENHTPKSAHNTNLREFNAVKNAEAAIAEDDDFSDSEYGDESMYSEEYDDDVSMGYDESSCSEYSYNGGCNSHNNYNSSISSNSFTSLPLYTSSTNSACSFIPPTSFFAQPSTTTTIPFTSYFSHHERPSQQAQPSQQGATTVRTHSENQYNQKQMSENDDELEKDPVNLLPSIQPLYYFRQHNSGSGTIDSTNCMIIQQAPKTLDQAHSMRSVIFAKDVESDVLSNMRMNQLKNKPNPNYISEVQTDINEQMRCILVDWMNEVASSYNLIPETLFLSVNILDRALSKIAVRRNKLQAVGVTALFISSKFCEISPPPIKEFIYIADHTYGREEILAIEKRILNEIEFELCSVQPYDFIEKFLENCGVVDNNIIKYLSYYLCELQLQNYQVLKFSPVVIASCSIMLALYLVDLNFWTSDLATCFGFSPQACEGSSQLTLEDQQLVITINDCLSSMFKFYVRMATGQISSNSVQRKYSHVVFCKVGECTRKVDRDGPTIPFATSINNDHAAIVTTSTSSAPETLN